MKSILRYPVLDLTYRQTLRIPTGFRIRHLAPGRASDVVIDIWAEVESDNPVVPVDVWIIGTGHQFPPDEAGPIYIGTVVMPDGFVWHLFVSV